MVAVLVLIFLTLSAIVVTLQAIVERLADIRDELKRHRGLPARPDAPTKEM